MLLLPGPGSPYFLLFSSPSRFPEFLPSIVRLRELPDEEVPKEMLEAFAVSANSTMTVNAPKILMPCRGKRTAGTVRRLFNNLGISVLLNCSGREHLARLGAEQAICRAATERPHYAARSN